MLLGTAQTYIEGGLGAWPFMGLNSWFCRRQPYDLGKAEFGGQRGHATPPSTSRQDLVRWPTYDMVETERHKYILSLSGHSQGQGPGTMSRRPQAVCRC